MRLVCLRCLVLGHGWLVVYSRQVDSFLPLRGERSGMTRRICLLLLLGDINRQAYFKSYVAFLVLLARVAVGWPVSGLGGSSATFLLMCVL